MRAARVTWIVALGLLAACTSPEATRQRAGGAGADVGNRREPVELHAGADPYYRTPIAMPAPRGTPVAASARRR
jgi:hypothetical protein